MEEILASIRRIISEDTPADSAAQSEEASPEAEASVQEESVLELTTMLDDDGAVVDLNAQSQPVAQPLSEPEPAAAEIEMTEQEPAPMPIDPEDSLTETPAPDLLSDPAAEAASTSFAALASTIQSERMALPAHMPLGDGTRTLEDMVVESLRPMLKDWLDQNLPQIVERLVQREIQRIARQAQD